MSQNTSPQPGDVIDGHVLTSSGQWIPLAPSGPAVPSEQPLPGQRAYAHPGASSGAGAGHGMQPPPSSPNYGGSSLSTPPSFGEFPRQARKAGKGKKVLIGVGGAAVLVLAIAVATSGAEDATPVDTASTDSTEETVADGAAEAAPAVAEPGAPEVDLAQFTEIDAATWERIAKDPEAAAGERVIVFAEVTQFDSATGTEAFLANVGSTQPAGEFELETNTVVGGAEVMLDGVVQGDVVRVLAEVIGSYEYETQIGGSTVVPALAAAAVESVGYLDITADAGLGDATWDEYGGVEVGVTVTNSGGTTMNYSVDVVAENADGSVQLGATSAYVENLAPGQAANTTADFYDDLPSDAVFKVVAVDRYSY